LLSDMRWLNCFIVGTTHQLRRFRMIRRVKYGYPPDKQEKATQTVLEQAELLCKDWAA